MRILLPIISRGAKGCCDMARLNVYLPDELYDLANRWRGTLNLSEICARALREELSAVESSRTTINLSNVVRKSSSREARLLHAFPLKETFVVEVSTRTSIRDELGAVAASYLDRWLCDGSLLAIAGGRQTWSVIRNLSPRNVRLNIAALGYGQHDPVALHTHSNTLLTLAWLLYAPRAQAHLVGSSKFKELWQLSDKIEAVPKYFVVASCSKFLASSPFAELLGKDVTNRLLDEGVAADFAYSFFRSNGRLVNVPIVAGVDQSVISAETLRRLSQRADARVILIAGGTEKASVAAWALKNKLCNTLIVDSELADQLLVSRGGGANAD